MLCSEGQNKVILLNKVQLDAPNSSKNLDYMVLCTGRNPLANDKEDAKCDLYCFLSSGIPSHPS